MDPAREVGALVLGAGLQGVGIALELAERGIASTLIDQDELPLNRAGLRNEGKIHLGIIYANDRSRGTAFLQLDGALCFARVLNRWMRGDSAWLAKSTTQTRRGHNPAGGTGPPARHCGPTSRVVHRTEEARRGEQVAGRAGQVSVRRLTPQQVM